MRRTKTSTRFFSIMIVVGLMFGCSVGRVQGAASDSEALRFDGVWWQHANDDEQQGFIYGYQDCRQPPKVAQASIVDYQKAVSAAVGNGKSGESDVVTKAIENAWTTLKSRDTRGGESYSGPHGYLDGEWWGSFQGPWPSSVADADRGYLEGYLDCASAPVMVQAVRRYQAAINQHYASGRHDHDKIADVLQRLLKSRAGS